jgi:3-carboxy-cis,cis-muconate cycloisomerase
MLDIFGDVSLIRAALDFEAALARAQAVEGLVAADEAALIAETCSSVPIDLAVLAEEAAHAGTLAIPLVRRLRAAVGAGNEAAAGKVHLGATSQDVADTALMLQAKLAGGLIVNDLVRLTTALAALAEAHAETPITGRTLLQDAMPISFGLKAAGWLLAVDSALARFEREQESALMLQLGGAAGTLAGMGGRAIAVAERMAAALGLGCPLMPWHTRRDGIAGLAGALAIVAGALGKIARDVSLLAQNAVAEAFEPRVADRGGSSAMTHKRNPTGCQIALSAAIRAPGLAATILAALPQEHERGLGGWQAEGPVLVELFVLAHGAVRAMLPVVENLEIDAARMRANLEQAGIGTDFGEAAALVRSALAQRHGE